MTTRATRAALYVRVSTQDQTVDPQLDELRQLASHRRWQVIGEFVDQGVSGTKDRRPELDKLIRATHVGRVDVVVCVRFDRFARSVRHLVTALEDFRTRNVDFVSARDSIDTTTPAGRFTFHVIAAVAELERELIRERTLAGLASARRRGRVGGNRPVELDQERVLALRSEGMSVRQISSQLGVSKSVVGRLLLGVPQTPSKVGPP